MNRGRTFAVLFGVIFMIAGIIAGVLGTKSYLEAKETQDRCTATVTGSLVRYEETLVSVSKGSGKNTKEVKEIQQMPVFEYTVNGVTFTAEDTALATKEQKYAPGSVIDVHYDPESPADNYLVPMQKAAILLPVIFGSVFTIVGLIVMIAGIKGKIRVK